MVPDELLEYEWPPPTRLHVDTGFPVWGSKMDTVEAVVRGVAAFMGRLVGGRVGI